MTQGRAKLGRRGFLQAAAAIPLSSVGAVTTRAGRYVQGGGCATVGVAGLIQSGGFGSFSKGYGLAAAGLLEAEVVTADGAVRIANACRNPERFWGLKGGGGGSLGVVTKLTLRTRPLPETSGAVFGRIRASSHWGSNYPRLTRVKREYDPAGLFFVHHGVGRGQWSPHGFVSVAGQRPPDALSL